MIIIINAHHHSSSHHSNMKFCCLFNINIHILLAYKTKRWMITIAHTRIIHVMLYTVRGLISIYCMQFCKQMIRKFAMSSSVLVSNVKTWICASRCNCIRLHCIWTWNTTFSYNTNSEYRMDNHKLCRTMQKKKIAEINGCYNSCICFLRICKFFRLNTFMMILKIL